MPKINQIEHKFTSDFISGSVWTSIRITTPEKLEYRSVLMAQMATQTRLTTTQSRWLRMAHLVHHAELTVSHPSEPSADALPLSLDFLAADVDECPDEFGLWLFGEVLNPLALQADDPKA